MVSKGQIVGIDWNRIARLHSHVLAHMNSLTASRCHINASSFCCYAQKSILNDGLKHKQMCLSSSVRQGFSLLPHLFILVAEIPRYQTRFKVSNFFRKKLKIEPDW